MTPGSLARLGLLLALAAPVASLAARDQTRPARATPAPAVSRATGAPASAPAAPAPRPKRKVYVDGVLDTGQFLPDTAVLGRINDRPITVREFLETYFNAYAPDRPATDSAGRVEWLNSMVNKAVLGALARRVERPMGFEERLKLREHTQRVLSNVLFTRAVMDSVRIDDAEVRAIYDREYHLEHRLRHILFRERFAAEDVMRRLRDGSLGWSEAVKRYNISVKDRGPDGEIGWAPRLGLGWEMAQVIQRLEPGEIGGPLADRDGYHIVQLVERRPTEAPLFESVERAIREQVRKREIGRLSERLIEILRRESALEYDTAAVAWAAGFFQPAVTSKRGETGETDIHFNARMPEIAPADTGRVLARYRDGVVTLNRVNIEYGALSPFTRPSIHTWEGMRNQIDAIVLEPYRARMAAERGLDRDPLAVEQIEKKKEQIAVERLYQDSIEARILITPAERRKYYDEHVAQFITYPSARYALLVAEDSVGAAGLAERLRAGERAADILRADSLAGRTRTGYIREERENQSGPFHALLFFEMKPGQVQVWGPDKNGRWGALQLLSFDSGRQLSYEEGKGYADDHLRAIRSEELLQALLERHRRGYRIELYVDRVPRVRMVDPSAGS
jgi:peptidyl-prolyl cis-trans isomerase C